MTTSVLKNTTSYSCGIVEEILEIIECPTAADQQHLTRQISKATFVAPDEDKGLVYPSPFSIAPPHVGTRLTTKFMYNSDKAAHRRYTVKKPMRIAASIANAINIDRFKEGPEGAKPNNRLPSVTVIDPPKGADAETLSVDSDQPKKLPEPLDSRSRALDNCSELEKGIIREINRLRRRPKIYINELIYRRREMIGSTMWTRCSGAVRLIEGTTAIDDAIKSLRAMLRMPEEDGDGYGSLSSQSLGSARSKSNSQSLRAMSAHTISDDEDGGPESSDTELLRDSDDEESFKVNEDREQARSLQRKGPNSLGVTPVGSLNGTINELQPSQLDGSPSFLRAPPVGAARIDSLGLLSVSTGLCLAAQDHAYDIGPRGLTTHRGTSAESSVRERAERYGVWLESCYELISFGIVDPVDMVCQFLIDDGVPTRFHRKLLLGTKFSDMGIKVAPHAVFGALCVLVLAGRFMTFGSRELAVPGGQASASYALIAATRSTPAPVMKPLDEACDPCPKCLSMVASNNCVIGPHGRPFHRHCLLCEDCHSTLARAFYLHESLSDGEVVLCVSCYSQRQNVRCSVCGSSCAFTPPLKSDTACHTIKGQTACKECFLNEAAMFSAGVKNHKRVDMQSQFADMTTE